MNYINWMYDINKRPLTKYPSQFCRHITEIVKVPTGRILDVGCGRTEFTRGFEEAGLEAYGVDNTESDFQKGIRFSLCDASKENMPFDSCYFKCVFSKSFIEHLTDPHHYMRESLRVLEKGGFLITLTPNGPAQKEVFYDDPTHVTPYDEHKLLDLMSEHGLKNPYVIIFYQYPPIWRWPFIKFFSFPFGVRFSRRLTEITGIKYFRWTRETMLMGVGTK